MLPYRYWLKMTGAYPPDVRVFVARLVPIITDFYDYHADFYSIDLNQMFYWGVNVWDAQPHRCIGEEDEPHLYIERGRHGEAAWSDEYEASFFELFNFSPPFLPNTIELSVKCRESFMRTDFGSYGAELKLATDDSRVYSLLVAAIQKIENQFKNAQIVRSNTLDDGPA